MPHPRLKSHARPLRRGAGAVQLGLAAPAGAVLEGLTEAETRWLHRLDGAHGRERLYAAASEEGIAPERVRALLDALRASGLLVEHPTDRANLTALGTARWDELGPDAENLAATRPRSGDGYTELAARGGQHVVVGGDGGVADALAQLLRRGGVGRVEVGAAALDDTELGLRREQLPGVRPDLPLDRPDLVVLLASGALDPGTGAPWGRHGIPHLPVVVQTTRVLIGPLVRPDSGPCLRCCDLHRADRDPAWPHLLAQLSPARPVGWSRPVEAATPLTAAAAGLAAMVAHHHLDAGSVPAGVSMELSTPWPTLVHRRWPAHPRCGCRGGLRAAAHGGPRTGTAGAPAAGSPGPGAGPDVLG